MPLYMQCVEMNCTLKFNGRRLQHRPLSFDDSLLVDLEYQTWKVSSSATNIQIFFCDDEYSQLVTQYPIGIHGSVGKRNVV